MPTRRLTPASSATLAFILVFFVSAAARADSITLAWDASTESRVVGYYVYIGTAPGIYSTVVDVGSATLHTFPDAQPGRTYYLTVAAYGPGRVAGAQAPEVVATVGAAPSLANPGNRSSPRASQVSVSLAASDPDGEPLTFTASNLPPGLSLNGQTRVISGVPTIAGTYKVSVTVADGSANVTTQVFLWTIVATDTMTPTISITSPSGDTHTTAGPFVTLTGLATDDVGVALVKWSNSTGGSGIAAGTTNWSVIIPLQTGSNVLTITAVDDSGRVAKAVATVTSTRFTPLQLTALAASRPAPGLAGEPTRFSATASGGLAPYQYKWWIWDGGSWSVVRDWSQSGVLIWTPPSANNAFRVAVWVRGAGASADSPDNDLSHGSISFPTVSGRRPY